MAASVAFPLFTRCEAAGVLDGESALIVAPTATGKSYIGRSTLYRAIRKDRSRVHAYLVPFRALANEQYETILDELRAAGDDETRVRIATGDYTDAVKPESANLLVATYERFMGLIESDRFKLGTVVADEFHLIDDESRGPAVEGLFARLLAMRRPQSLIALSAVIENGDTLADWLGVKLVEGKPEDRAVPVRFDSELVDDRDATLHDEIAAVLRAGKQAIVFCRSKLAAQKVALELAEVVGPTVDPQRKEALARCGARLTEEVEDAAAIRDLIQTGAAFHHAGLVRPARQAIEEAFRQRDLSVIACTPTLAAGVNLPAELVVVRDVLRTEVVRGRHIPVVLASAEVLNMLGRAGRPLLVEQGRGLVLIEKKVEDRPDIERLRRAIDAGRGSAVQSRFPESYDAMLRFVVSTVVDRGEASLEDLAEVFRHTLWYHQEQADISFERPLHADMMEDLPAYARAEKEAKTLELADVEVVPDGVEGSVRSKARKHAFALRVGESSCDCEAAKFRPFEVCKHLAFAIHELLFGEAVDPEIHSRALYACMHLFRKTLDLGTRLKEAVDLLLAWGLLTRVPGGVAATTSGRVASHARFDVLLVRQAALRVSDFGTTTSHRDVALCTVDDYFGPAPEREKWHRAVEQWVDGVDADKIKLPKKFRGDFENGLEDLARVASLYAELASASGLKDVTRVCDQARAALLYGVAPEVVPLAALKFAGLGRRRCAALYHQYGIHGVDELAKASPELVRLPGLGPDRVREWVTRAAAIVARRDADAARSADPEDAMDDLLAAFRVEPISLGTGAAS